MANHEKQTIILKNGQRLVLKPGQFHTSMQKLALRWRWSRGKVIRFFSMLTDEKMVTTKCTTHGTTVTIEKWGFYQDRRSTDDTTNSTRTRRIKNGKIRVIEDPKRPNHAKITYIYECRYNKKSVVRYILPTLIGLGIIIFSVLMISQGLESIESHHGVWEITDMGLIAFFLGGVYAGVILICYAFGRRINPAPYFFGVLVAAFGLCELFFVADDSMKNESTVGQTIGTSLPVFQLNRADQLFIIFFSKQI